MMETKKITALRQEGEALLAREDLSALKEKITQVEERTYQEGFWNLPEAKAIMQELGELKEREAQVMILQDLVEEVRTAEFVVAQESENLGYQEELAKAGGKLEALLTKWRLEQYLAGKYDHLGAIFSLHAGQGGTEAMDWTSMLKRAYERYFERKGWRCKLISESLGEEAGLKEVSFEVTGKNVYGLLKGEAGTHRLVRLSPFNANNLRQTSFALVEVLPLIEASDKEIKLNEHDLAWHFSRAGGAGGQNVNKVNTAVELTYLPLNLVVKCREERFQEQNKQRALQILKAKLARAQEQEHAQEIKDLKGDKIMASWGTQIRNYVLHPYQLVKDTRTQLETSDTAGVLDGDLDFFVLGNLPKLHPT